MSIHIDRRVRIVLASHTPVSVTIFYRPYKEFAASFLYRGGTNCLIFSNGMDVFLKELAFHKGRR